MDEIIQNIYDKIEPLLPEKWNKIALYADFFGNSSCVEYYVEEGEGGYLSCLADSRLNGEQLIEVIDSIDDMLYEYRTGLDESERWRVMSLYISADGNSSVEFDYKDHPEDYVAYQSDWIKKHITNVENRA